MGKSLISAAKALWFAVTHPGTTTIIVSATQRQSSLMFDKIMGYLESSYLLEQMVRRKTRTMVAFTNGSQMKALPCGRQGASLRGETVHLAIIDEASFVPEQVITQAITPMLSSTDGDMIMISTRTTAIISSTGHSTLPTGATTNSRRRTIRW